MEREAIWKLLGDVQAQIRVFDTKAQAALGINGILAGFLGSQSFKLMQDLASSPRGIQIVAVGLLIACFVCLFASFGYALRTVNPQLELDQPRSRFFFGHIAERFGRNFEAAASDLFYASGERLDLDIATQVAVNSFICNVKALRCRRALMMTALALAFYLVALVPVSIAAFEGGERKHIKATPATPLYVPTIQLRDSSSKELYHSRGVEC